MLIGLHDAEREHMPRKTFPNLALMKLSAYHKLQGDVVEWWNPLTQTYDIVYSSKVFDFTPENPYLPDNTIRGGTGYDVKSKLDPEIDAMFPDYSIYPDCDYAIGYITRGCPNHCRWCLVPEKEGELTEYSTIDKIRRADTDKVVLMDNNVLASRNVHEILDSLIFSGLHIDFNQGLDARLVCPGCADRLARINWIKYIRFSCDTVSQIPAIENV
ncbi:MAG: radical SAM protein, partial [Oscillospiraceae bacterium]|nr:radical SAM protein [Oscillospiraceae bacterium]